MMERRFPRTFDSLASIDAFITEFLRAQALDRNLSFDLNLIIEELFTNMVKYSRPGREPIAVSLKRDDAGIRIVLQDFGVEPFDVTKGSTFDPKQPLEERSPGGVGLYLVHTLADSVHYEYHKGTSTVTVMKRLES